MSQPLPIIEVPERRKNRINPVQKTGPLFESSRYKDVKDPCPVYDGELYHIFGSGGDVRTEEWEILHATAPSLEGPWKECDSIIMNGLTGKRVAAPGVIYDVEDKCFHMFVQTDFTTPDSSIIYLISKNGSTFERVETILSSSVIDEEIALYDPHPIDVNGEKYIVYSSTSPSGALFIPRPDIFLAKSINNTWKGPWKRMGKIVDHEDIADHHNRKDDPHYEWGIEGPQVALLPSGQFLLNATCFLPKGLFGTRQRVFFAIATTITGPYLSLGPVLFPKEEWESGENGHAAIFQEEEKVHLFYQGRSKTKPNPVDNNWQYGIATFNSKSFKEY